MQRSLTLALGLPMKPPLDLHWAVVAGMPMTLPASKFPWLPGSCSGAASPDVDAWLPLLSLAASRRSFALASDMALCAR